MKGVDTKGLIVKCTDYGESDRIVTVITEKLGKVRGIAKGARRSVKRFGGCLETFSLVSLVIREGRGLGFITEGRVLKDFREIKKDLEKISYGSYMLELSDALTMDDGAGAKCDVFPMLLEAVKRLSEGREPEAETRRYEIRLLSSAGYLPSFLSCLSCGSSVLDPADKTGDGVRFSPARGGVVCPRCSVKEASSLDLISAGTLKTLSAAAAGNVTFTKSSLEESGRLMRSFISHHLDKKLKSLDFIDQMKGL